MPTHNSQKIVRKIAAAVAEMYSKRLDRRIPEIDLDQFTEYLSVELALQFPNELDSPERFEILVDSARMS